ncbi:HD domain-containing protein [Marinobacterium sp. D7]|uniref:HD-GYP domain-containing protein n=1 Tax=Marinobacterium ramblicola TaxID=2849041 RepID=UPI001C2CF759|nr:HD domain-containing phosphohydrolase [Marinobacterium ramblicola]MBV1787561.1 HD domain-containing protein [Marinobacterium ramblicola]
MSELIYLCASEEMLESLSGCLREDYSLAVVHTPAELIDRLQAEDGVRYADYLFLLDAQALERFGYERCASAIAAAQAKSVPALLLCESTEQKERSVALGCADYLCRPLSVPVTRSKLGTHLRMNALRQKVDAQHDAMEHMLSELAVVQDAAILCLAAIARVRDHSTGNHILRTQHYVKALAEHLRHHPRFAEELDGDTIELLYKTAALHDIGKVAIPDSILQKPSKLTDDEFELMKRHTIFGYQAMHTAEQLMERNVGVQAAKFLRIGQQVTLSHHERWDGGGYPQGLKGEEIPLVARLMAVADVYDAVCSRRPYKDALSHDTASKTILEGRGTHFDPDVVDAFDDLKDTFEYVAGILEDRFPSLGDLTLHSLEGFETGGLPSR